MIIHLQTHSVYSLRRSILPVPSLVAEVTARGHQAVALTDTDNLYGMVPFVQAARQAGIRPILGAELSLALDDKPPRVTLLVKDESGYHNLCRLITRYHLGGRIGVPPEDLAAHGQGLILLSGGRSGAIPRLVATGRMEQALGWLRQWRESFECYIQLGPWWPARDLRALAASAGLPMVAAQEASYLRPEDSGAWYRLQMAHGHGHPAPGPRHLATDAELIRTWTDLPEAIAAMATIAEVCTFEPTFGVPRLPRFPTPDSTALLRQLCEEGLERRYRGSQAARERMQSELAVIEQMGFVDYFLIAWDLVRFAREQGIPHMPRGSAAGSLVLYLLGISQICPIEHHLCFERFLNPERKGLPDIDVDFDWRRRDEVVDYCYRTYGEDHVARIATHQHLGARGAVRLAGSALGLEEAIIDEVARRMPGSFSSADIAQSISRAPECQGLPLDREPYKSLVSVAREFEGLPDHLGLHPCGVVISREPLTDLVPLEISAKGPVVTQFEMHAAEEIGLLKMDLLGNRNLAILKDAVDLVNDRHGQTLDPETIPLDDEKGFALLRSGRTLGIYQLESGGVQGLLRQFMPEELEDVSAITSLYRPGPIDGGITPRYVARRHGKEPVVYPDPCLESVLAHTYGCILFQEQCLQVTSVYAGMGLGESDNLRRGISKRIPPEVERIKDRFFEGAARMGRDPERTAEVWELLRNFAGYGFVKAHAASCAALAVREAYLKARWPIEYLAVVLSTGMGYYPPRVYIEDARAFGATIALPCVNRSQAEYTVEDTNILRVGLAYIKGIGPAGVRAILEGRGDRPFTDLADLRRRSNLARPELETLIKLGACDSFGSRPALLWQLGAMGATEAPRQARLFELGTMPAAPPDLGDYSPQTRQAIERELLGFTVTSTPMPRVVGCVPFAVARQQERMRPVSVVAEIVSRFSHRTKATNEKMSFLTLSDGDSHMQAVLFPEAYRRWVRHLRRGPLVFNGFIDEDKGEPLLVVRSVEGIIVEQGA